MASLCYSGGDLLLLSPCNVANGVLARVSLLQRKYRHHGSASWTNRGGTLARVLSRRGVAVAGGVREAQFRVECSDTQTIVSVQVTEESKGVCEPCRGLGFRICDYCEGEKVNVPVKGRANRFHRRCPECKAVGIMMCYRCKVFKCVTFPDWDDGSLEKKR